MPPTIQSYSLLLLGTDNVIYVVRSNGVLTPLQTLSGDAQTLIFRPGELDPRGNVYSDWATLVGAAILLPSPKTIVFDDRLQACSIPIGAWDFGDGCTFKGLLPAINSLSPNRVQVTCPNGVTFTTPLYEISDIQLTYSGVGALMTIPGDGRNRVFYMTRNGRTSSSGAGGRIFDISANSIWTAVLFDLGFIVVSGGGLFFNVIAGATQAGIRCVESGGTFNRVPANCVAGPAGPTYQFIADELNQIATAQAGMPGGVIIPTFVYGTPNLPYTPGDGTKWVDPDPTTVQGALDRMAALLFTLNANNPIP